MNTRIVVLKVRVKDKHNSLLSRMAFEVNQVWNVANEETSTGENPTASAFDLMTQLKGVREERNMCIPASTVQQVIAEHAKCRRQTSKSKLRWRTSGGSRCVLGWVPFRGQNLRMIRGQIRFASHYFSVWDSYDLSKYDLRSGSFSQDARGRWYFSAAIEVPIQRTEGVNEVGVDLGLKTTATCSDGTILSSKRPYRVLAKKLGMAQRANKGKQVRNIHAKIKNRRLDTNHKFTTKMVKNSSLIAVGNVSSCKLAKTKMAKSVLDAGWNQLKTQLDYKSKAMQVAYIEVDEKYTTQTCSSCGCIPRSSPKGRAGLGIREWTCVECGTVHDRDINAAKNILRLGHQALAGGVSLAHAERRGQM